MDNISVSKGIFAHKGSYKIGRKKRKSECHDYVKDGWYVAYKETWSTVQEVLKDVRNNMIQQVMADLISFASDSSRSPTDAVNSEIPTAILLTGINVPDHVKLFDMIATRLKASTPHLVTLWSRDSNNMKYIVRDMVYQLMNDEESDEETVVPRSQCTMCNLKTWYQTHSRSPIIIIVPDFESFSSQVLHDFILILSTYSNTFKFLLIFGVATTLHVVHRTLSYDATSKLSVKVFHMQTQIERLADVIDGIVFSSVIPFRLTGRAFQLLSDIFLFYDFSVDRFMQNYKACMIQHFYDCNVNSLCCRRGDTRKRISALTAEELKEIRKLPSIEKHLQKVRSNGKANEDEPTNEKFKNLLEQLLNQFHDYIGRFLLVLKCLHRLVSTLPNAPLGKQLREIYTKAVFANNIVDSQEYKECLQLLGFLSKGEFLAMLEEIRDILGDVADPVMKEFQKDLEGSIANVREASLNVAATNAEVITADKKLSRAQLKETLLKLSQKTSRSPYKQAQQDLINYLDRKIFSVHLTNPSLIPANEIFCYSDGNSIKRHIRGSVRGAIHTGLNDPEVYLQCDCCKLENDDALPATLPDLSIIYKLHLESRKLINMYDWLQAFTTIVNPTEDTTATPEINVNTQARFTRAVEELQFLGFIKASRAKADHVKRLT